jgi:hypothetical protein
MRLEIGNAVDGLLLLVSPEQVVMARGRKARPLLNIQKSDAGSSVPLLGQLRQPWQ